MDPIGAIITGLRTIAGAIIPPLKKKYFDQPKVYIIINGNGASRFSGKLPDLICKIYHQHGKGRCK